MPSTAQRDRRAPWSTKEEAEQKLDEYCPTYLGLDALVPCNLDRQVDDETEGG